MMTERGFATIYIILGIVVVVAVAGGTFFLTRSDTSLQSVNSSPDKKEESATQASKEVDKFIIANPVDLTQIKKISKFRSCSGHDFSGQNVDGIREKNRSMKHYFKPVDVLSSSIGEVKVFAPFDGDIKSIRDEREPRGKETILRSETSSWDVTIFHLDLLPSLREGSKITTGQLIGHAHIASQGNDFDIAVTKFVGGVPDFKSLSSDQGENMQDFFFSMMMMDSVFNYMTEGVLSNFKEFGITAENIIIPAAERDQAPCTFERTENASDWVEL